MTPDFLDEMHRHVERLSRFKSEFGEDAIGDWCNGLVCLECAIHLERKKLAQEADAKRYPLGRPRKAVVAAMLLLFAIGVASAQTITEGTHYCTLVDGSKVLSTWTGYVDGINGVWMFHAYQSVTSKVWYAWSGTNAPNPVTSNQVNQVWWECP